MTEPLLEKFKYLKKYFVQIACLINSKKEKEKKHKNDVACNQKSRHNILNSIFSKNFSRLLKLKVGGCTVIFPYPKSRVWRKKNRSHLRFVRA